MSLYLGNTLLAGVATPLKIHNLFDFKWADYELSDQNWLRADTYSWQDGTVYSDAYNHLVDDIDGETATSETIGSYTISYYLADDGHKITTDEATVLNIYNQTGVAWYYVLDTTNQRFKLPRENATREELVSLLQAPVKGTGMSVGLTDGTSNAGLRVNASDGLVGADNVYGKSVGTSSTGTWSSAASESIGITTDATKSGIVADLSNSTSTSIYKGKKYLYFYVGQFSQTATEQTAGLNSELFNGKLDLDLGNASSVTKETIVGWGMPDYRAGVSKTWGTSYTATTDGWIFAGRKTSSTGTATEATLTIDGVSFEFQYFNASNGAQRSSIFMPIKKGSSYIVNNAGQSNVVVFYPCIGG